MRISKFGKGCFLYVAIVFAAAAPWAENWLATVACFVCSSMFVALFVDEVSQ